MPQPASRSLASEASACSAVLLLITALPYLYAAVSTPADLSYTGLMFDVADHAEYWSWVTASARGLFISNTMTPEPNPPIFMNGMMWLLAVVQTGFNLSFPALFQVWRVAAACLLVCAALSFYRIAMTNGRHRRTAVTIAMIGAGAGWVLVVVKRLTGAAGVWWPLDLYIVEPNTFWTLLSYPYYAVAEGLLLWTFASTLRAHTSGSRLAILWAGIAAFTLGFLHVYDLIVVYAVIAIYGLVLWIAHRRFPGQLAIVGLVVLVVSAPVALYYARLTSGDPLWRSILAQYPNAGVWTPTPPHLLIVMGAPLILAAIEIVVGRPQDDTDWFLVTWAVVGGLVIYVPVVYQIKLIQGWQFPLAALAARRWHVSVSPALDRWFAERCGVRSTAARSALAAAVLIALIVPTNVYLYTWRFVDLRRHQSPYYLHRDEVAALEWLARHATSDDVVLSSLEFGRFVPNYGRSRAFLAHWAMTNRYFERRDQAARFLGAGVDDGWRRELTKREGLSLVVWNDWSGDVKPEYDPGQSSWLEPVFLSAHARIYRVRGLPEHGK